MEQGYGTDDMFFLLRIAFWLTIVLALLPSGGAQQSAQAKVGATEAVVAAGAAVSDMSNFCDRQPDACVVGAQAAVAIGQRAQAGAKMVYEFFNDHTSHGSETGSVPKPKWQPKLAAVRPVPASPGSQSTLKDGDLDPVWQGPPARTENVPLPRKAPHRKA
ncbi:MAG: hypothetical protein QOF09_249 [Alphaproteobacteria bacterium]|jgi:hypothetical protein|nr:hypothetical protein [Alphaproteobacteria bacterium]